MTNRSYQELWKNTYTALQNLVTEDVPLTFERDLTSAFDTVASLYLRYVKSITNLEKCYDLIVHPQKRQIIGKILEATIGRLLELKNELVDIESRDFHFFDEHLLNFKMTPHDLELPIPHWDVASESKMVYQEDYQIFLQANAVKKKDFTGKINSPNDAVLILQRHERARQGRLHTILLLAKFRIREGGKIQKFLDRQEAAILIQKTWRGHHQRQHVRSQWAKERRLIGMLPALPPANIEDTYAYKKEHYLQLRREMQKKRKEDYETALMTTKEALKKGNEIKIMEKYEDDIRDWYNKHRESHKNFPYFPSENEGGSKLIFDPEAMEELQRQKGSAKKNKAAAKARRKKERAKRRSERKRKDAQIGYSGGISLSVPLIIKAFREYKGIWESYDDPENYNQKHDETLIKKQVLPIIKEEIRLKVDPHMRAELEDLHNAVAKDKGKKGKRKRKARKKKTQRKRGRKKKKDITANRSLDSLYEELLEMEIIKPYPKTSLHDFLGDYNYIGTYLTKKEIEPVWHYPGDLRRVVTEYCILPLSNPKLHESAPFVKSILFIGPPGVGKKILVYALCTAVQATLFDLTPSNIVGKYPGKAGIRMLIHLVNKVARAMQPSIIMVNDVEKTFVRRVPKTDESEPRRIRRPLPKLVKGIKPTDLLLVCGISNLPFLVTDMKGLRVTFSKMIYVPPPDFGSRHILWKKFLSENGYVLPQFQISSLAKVSDGYTGKQIKAIVNQVMSKRRVAMLSEVPLSEIELIKPLSQLTPLYQAEIAAYEAWFSKTPLGKRRKRLFGIKKPQKRNEKKKRKKN